jgi:4-hydroxybenzoate polyprenyltransferase
MWAVLAGLGWYGGLGAAFAAAMALVAGLLLFLHLFRKSASLDSLNQDFFLANIAVSFCVMAGIVANFF